MEKHTNRGKSNRQALRVLKRRLSNLATRTVIHDPQPHQAAHTTAAA